MLVAFGFAEADSRMTRGSFQVKWDDGDPTPMNDKFWESPHHRDNNGNPQPTTMTPEEIAAAKLLGHTPETWNHGMTEDEAAARISASFRARAVRKAFLKHLEEKVGGALSLVVQKCAPACFPLCLHCSRHPCCSQAAGNGDASAAQFVSTATGATVGSVAQSPLASAEPSSSASPAKPPAQRSRLCCCLDRKPEYGNLPQSDEPAFLRGSKGTII